MGGVTVDNRHSPYSVPSANPNDLLGQTLCQQQNKVQNNYNLPSSSVSHLPSQFNIDLKEVIAQSLKLSVNQATPPPPSASDIHSVSSLLGSNLAPSINNPSPMISPQNTLLAPTPAMLHAGLQPLAPVITGKDSRWLTLEVCREHQRGKCSRIDLECKFAHPPSHVEVQNGRVTCCFDSIKGKCQRKDPPCKYLHPPIHLREQLLQNGRTNLILRNMTQFNHPLQHFPMNPMPSTSTQGAFASPNISDKMQFNPSSNPILSQIPLMTNPMYIQNPYLGGIPTLIDANGIPMQNPLGTLMMPQKLDMRSGQMLAEANPWLGEQTYYPSMNPIESNLQQQLQVHLQSQLMSLNKNKRAADISDPLGLASNSGLIAPPATMIKRTALDKNGVPAMAYPSQYQQMALQIQAQHQALTGQALQSGQHQPQTTTSATPNNTQYTNLAHAIQTSSAPPSLNPTKHYLDDKRDLLRDEKPICRDYNQKRCFRTPCKYAHIEKTTEYIDVMCWDDMKGNCSRENCKFIHRNR